MILYKQEVINKLAEKTAYTKRMYEQCFWH